MGFRKKPKDVLEYEAELRRAKARCEARALIERCLAEGAQRARERRDQRDRERQERILWPLVSDARGRYVRPSL